MIKLTLPPDDVPAVDEAGNLTVPWRNALEDGGGVAGYGVPTGTLDRSGFATYDAATIAGTFAAAQMQIQAMANHIQVLSRHVAALQADIRETA